MHFQISFSPLVNFFRRHKVKVSVESFGALLSPFGLSKPFIAFEKPNSDKTLITVFKKKRLSLFDIDKLLVR